MSTPTESPQRYGLDVAGFACFSCWGDVPAAAAQCPRCHVSFIGERPARLWALEQELRRLAGERSQVAAEAGRLRASLLPTALLKAGATAGATTGVPVGAATLPTYPAATLPPRVPPHAASGGTWGGQQLLLALGGFLLLSGVAFFLYVVWDLVGLLGQAAIMATLTLGAAFAARLATLHRLPAAAETAAVLAAGLLALDVVSAYSLGLFGVDRTDENLYFGLTGLLAAIVLIGFHRMVPVARERDGVREALRPIQAYVPIASFVAAASPWFLLGLHESPGLLGAGAVRMSFLLLVIGVCGAVVAATAQRWDPSEAVRGLKTSTSVALVPALPAFAGHLLFALAEGYGGNDVDRLAAFVLLLAVPSGLAVAVGVSMVRQGRAATSWWVPSLWVAAAGSVLALGVWVWVTPRGFLLVLAVVAAVILIATGFVSSLRLVPDEVGSLAQGRWEVAAWVSGGFAVGLGLLVLFLDRAGFVTMADYLTGVSGVGDPVTPALSVWGPAVPFAGVAAYFSVVANGLWRTGSQNALTVGSGWFALVAAGLIAGRDGVEGDAYLAITAVALVAVACAGLRTWGITELRSPGKVGPGKIGPGATAWVHLAFGAVLVAWAMLCVSGDAWADEALRDVAVLALVAAVAYVAVAVAPGSVEVGWWTVLWISVATVANAIARGYSSVESFTLVPALALVVLGTARWFAGRTESSWGAVGLALLVGFVPSLLALVVLESATRTALVTLVGLALLLGGCALRWGAPVFAGSLGLVVVGLLQGDVWTAYVPTWLTLTLAGALLLAVGVGWERAIALGRRGAGWFGSLT